MGRVVGKLWRFPPQRRERVVTDLNRVERLHLTTNQFSGQYHRRIVNLPLWDDYYGYRQLKHGNLQFGGLYQDNQAKKTARAAVFLLRGIGSTLG